MQPTITQNELNKFTKERTIELLGSIEQAIKHFENCINESKEQQKNLKVTIDTGVFNSLFSEIRLIAYNSCFELLQNDIDRKTAILAHIKALN